MTRHGRIRLRFYRLDSRLPRAVLWSLACLSGGPFECCLLVRVTSVTQNALTKETTMPKFTEMDARVTLMPSFCIGLRSMLGFMFRIFAAPRSTIQ